MQGGGTFIQQTVCYQSVFFVCMAVRYTLFTSRTKRTALGNKCDKTPIQNNPQYEATAHFMHVR